MFDTDRQAKNKAWLAVACVVFFQTKRKKTLNASDSKLVKLVFEFLNFSSKCREFIQVALL